MGHLYLSQKRNIYKLYVFDEQQIQATINQPVADKRMESLAEFNHVARPSVGQQLTLNCVFKCRFTGNQKQLQANISHFCLLLPIFFTSPMTDNTKPGVSPC